jgi:hypothetical protein
MRAPTGNGWWERVIWLTQSSEEIAIAELLIGERAGSNYHSTTPS